MSQRIDYAAQSPELYKKMLAFSMAVKTTPVGKELNDLVTIRASQLNGCAFCLDMHVKEAKLHGERELRIHHIPIWRESELFAPRERAALEWTEAVTKLADSGISDALYRQMRALFSESEIVDLTFAVMTINAWNRLAVSVRAVPGSADKALGLDEAGLN
jgi:AhpD family alkylhydroperoxidase